ncbi:MAG: LAGLIDADG homing endonuclease [Candidatus Jorgensenbacteria bacterium GW2011_GWC1_48_8]|uniref:LAGLIDADG homing endonuclease n=1 Tax=Candidatus Jorgensenbacteria bacterium GW2011_GWC1_48_8 TaxID=1618666 RepID=A0A0G1UWA5_9BACT|nr:MAG: LAGLIDADG homing endonuclease [Candidatus Jorgensenbacteria bacterium GW2011_GWC1_48_8]
MKVITQIPVHVAWYVSGFVDGEGSFNISLRKKSDYKTGWQPVLSFNVSQRERTILALMKQHFGVGIIKQRKDGLYSYDVANPNALNEVIIPFFTRYGFLSQTKKKNFSLFKKAVGLMANKKHLTKDGLDELLEIREKINIGAGRTRKYTKKDVLLESSETIR